MCEHPGCTCKESRFGRGARNFCSAACSDADSLGIKSACLCGHPGCEAPRHGATPQTRS